MHVQKWKDNLVESVLSFHQVSSENQTQVCQTCMSNMFTWSIILPFHRLWIFFKTWWIARSLSKLVRCLILPTLLELILAGLEPILAVPQLSVHSQVEAPCWQGLCCHLPPSVSLGLGYLLPKPLEALHFFFFVNEWQHKLIPEPWTPKTLQHVSSFVPENILQTFSRFNWGFWEVLLCFFLAKIEGRYQEVLAYHIYLVSFENTESWD